MALPLYFWGIGVSSTLGFVSNGLVVYHHLRQEAKKPLPPPAQGPIGNALKRKGEDSLVDRFGCIKQLFGEVDTYRFADMSSDATIKDQGKTPKSILDLKQILSSINEPGRIRTTSRKGCALSQSVYDWNNLHKPKQVLSATFAVRGATRGWFLLVEGLAESGMTYHRSWNRTLTYGLASLEKKGNKWEIRDGEKITNLKFYNDPNPQLAMIGTAKNHLFEDVEFWERSVNSSMTFGMNMDNLSNEGESVGNYVSYSEKDSAMKDIWVLQLEEKSVRRFAPSFDSQINTLLSRLTDIFKRMDIWEGARSNSEVLVGDYYSSFFGEHKWEGGFSKISEKKAKHRRGKKRPRTMYELADRVNIWYRNFGKNVVYPPEIPRCH